MSLTPPKRLFNITTLSTVMYDDVADDVKNKGYVAISHVWGDQKKYTASMFGIVGVDWDIPLSDPNKISRLADAMMEYDMQYCWFDVLCMPQGPDNQHLVNLEIPFMGDYYSGASMTFVLSTVSYNVSSGLTEWSNTITNLIKSGREITQKERAILKKYRDEALDVSRDPWFTRVWTLQEHMMSKKLILFDLDGKYLILSEIFDNMAYVMEKGYFLAIGVFNEDSFEIVGDLSKIATRYKRGECDLADMLRTNSDRNCYKIHDKFYGILGMFGYKDFVVDYNINIDELNKKMAKYAYSKGDISWLAITGSLRQTGFIPPMYKGNRFIGKFWKDTSSNIKFDDETIYVNAVTVAIITEWAEGDMYDGGFKPMCSPLIKWGFKYSDIVHILTGFVEISDMMLEVSTAFLPMYTEEDRNIGVHRLYSLFGKDIAIKHIYDFGFKAHEGIANGGNPIVVKATTVETHQNIPLIAFGSIAAGDKIIILRGIYDIHGRSLGIIISNRGVRKGACLYPKIDIPDHLYTPYKFLL